MKDFLVLMERHGNIMFIGRERELDKCNKLYEQGKFQLFILYGRRRVGKTTFLKEFCKDKDTIFYSAEQSNSKMNLKKFSDIIFEHYNEKNIEPFSSWERALLYINEKQTDKQLVLVFDEFPYLAMQDKNLITILQHLIDHTLQNGKLFMVLCGSYMGFMEKEVLSAKSPLFGRRTAQLHMKTFDYRKSIEFVNSFSQEDMLQAYGIFGGTPLYLQQIVKEKGLRDNIIDLYLSPTGYLYEEPGLLMRQELQEPGVYSAIIEAIATGASRANEISVKVGEETAKCLKYIGVLIELGILYKEVPFGEKVSSRKTLYNISDFMFRFWYRYVAPNKTLLETDAQEIVWKRRIEPDLNHYMGAVFEKICKEYLLQQNALGNLPILFTDIGRWWGTDNRTHSQVEIDIIAADKDEYLIGECKWRNELLGRSILEELQKKADVFKKTRGNTWYILFSKSGFTQELVYEASHNEKILLVSLSDLFK